MRKLLFSLLFIPFVLDSYSQDTLLWKFSTDGEINSSPTISGNHIYFGSGDMNLYSVEKYSGRLNWKFKTQGKIHSTPFLYNEKVLFSSTDGNVYSLDKNSGKQNWKFKTKGEQRYDLWDYYLSSPVVYNKIVYIGSGDSTIYAIGADSGKLIWSYKTNGIIHATPVLKDSVLYLGSYDGYFYAFDSNTGKLIWKFKTVGDSYFPKGEIQKAAIIYNNSLIFGSRDYNIYCLDLKTGTGKWNMKERGSWIIATPFEYKNYIYFGTSDSHLFYCMDASSGEIKWSLPLNMRVYGSASIVDGKIVFGCFNGKLYFVDSETGKIEFTFQTEQSKTKYSSIYTSDDKFRSDFELYGKDIEKSEKQILSLGAILSTPLVEDHKIYFGDANGYFYGLKLR